MPVIRCCVLAVLLLLAGCATTRARPQPGQPLTFTHFGVAGWSISDGTHTVLVDPYFSRPEKPFDSPVSDESAVGAHTPALIAAPGLRKKVYDYSCRLMKVLGEPPVVLVTHFDDWRQPARTPLSEATRQDLMAFTAELRACAPGAEVLVPGPFEPFSR